MSKLAIEGGKPLRTKPFPSKKGMGKEELNLLTKVDGGITITNNSKLAKRARLFSDKCYSRNGSSRDPYFLGLNYRMTELQGAVSSYLLYPLTIDEKRLGRTTSNLVKALSREGIPASNSYAGGKPVYLYKIFQRKATYGRSHCPFDCPRHKKKIEYKKGLCPQAEEALKRLILLPCNEFFTPEDIGDIVRGVEKVVNSNNRRSRTTPIPEPVRACPELDSGNKFRMRPIKT